MDFAFEGMTVGTWGEVDGAQQWRVRASDGRVAHFIADRLTPVHELYRLARQALGEDDE